jgi:hypothetical protein
VLLFGKYLQKLFLNAFTVIVFSTSDVVPAPIFAMSESSLRLFFGVFVPAAYVALPFTLNVLLGMVSATIGETEPDHLLASAYVAPVMVGVPLAHPAAWVEPP